MSKETQSLIVNYADEQGRTAKTKLQFDITLDPTELQDAWDDGQALLSEITGCGLVSAEVTIPLSTIPTSPVSATGTNTAMDKIRWTFLDEDGNQAVFTTPAPLAADMMANDFSVNDTQADILAWIEWVKDNLQSPYGKAITTFVDAVREWRNRKSKNM